MSDTEQKPKEDALRVVHAPVNMAGIPWTNVQALRRRGVDAKLVVFNRGTLHPEADWSLERRDRLHVRLAEQLAAQARLLPQTDIFHFYFGLTLIPKALQFPLLRAAGKKSVFHYLGSDIRGKTPSELEYGKRADAEIVGSYDALRWVPEAYVVPPGLDLRNYVPRTPSDNPRPLVVHAPSNRDRKGTAYVIAACAQLQVDLEIIEGLHHDVARERYARADIVIDQLNAGWHGVFALEAMALGKPVIAHLKPDVIEKSAEGFGYRVPIVSATKETLVEALRPLVEDPARRRAIGAEGRAYVEAVHDADNVAGSLIEIYDGLTAPAPAQSAPLPRPVETGAPVPRLSLAGELRRLGQHSAIYGLGGMLSRILAVALLPLYTSYLGTAGFGKIELINALITVLALALQLGIGSAFFRFYFDSKDPARRTLVVRTSFWFTMGMATFGLVVGLAFAQQIADLLGLGNDPNLVRAGFIGLWAQTNYTQLTALFRVEERSVSYVIASISNILITVGMTVLLVVGLHKGATGAVVGNFIGTLTVYFVLLGYRRYQLGLQFDRKLLREMNRFGMPLVPSALALWAINFIDRFFVKAYDGNSELGVYSLAVRIASVITFLMIAFRLAWPAFAYSIEDDRTAKRTYSYVLTYLLFICCWISVALGTLAPWIVRLLAPKHGFQRADEAVGVLAFATTAYAGYTVLSIGIGRTRRTQFNWIITGAAAAINIGLNFWLIPAYGLMGAAVSTAAAYLTLFVLMTLNAQHVYPVPYQWRRILTLTGIAIALTTVGYEVGSLPLAIAFTLLYPVTLWPLGFYQRAELKRLRRLAPGWIT